MYVAMIGDQRDGPPSQPVKYEGGCTDQVWYEPAANCELRSVSRLIPDVGSDVVCDDRLDDVA